MRCRRIRAPRSRTTVGICGGREARLPARSQGSITPTGIASRCCSPRGRAGPVDYSSPSGRRDRFRRAPGAASARAPNPSRGCRGCARDRPGPHPDRASRQAYRRTRARGPKAQLFGRLDRHRLSGRQPYDGALHDRLLRQRATPRGPARARDRRPGSGHRQWPIRSIRAERRQSSAQLESAATEHTTSNPPMRRLPGSETRPVGTHTAWCPPPAAKNKRPTGARKAF